MWLAIQLRLLRPPLAALSAKTMSSAVAGMDLCWTLAGLPLRRAQGRGTDKSPRTMERANTTESPVQTDELVREGETTRTAAKYAP
jgi:hypothetical protein